ncbi:MAG: HAMP domain-containing protein [Bacteroidetes bacterium]|nr:HAMP domain-containing protein [Bacteroidota bacterium]
MLEKIKNTEVSGFLKNLKFVRKLQVSFFVIAAISAAIAINNFIQINNFENAKNQIFKEYIGPREKIDELYSDFQKIQFALLKLSMVDFESEFNTNMSEFDESKSKFDENLESLLSSEMDESITKELKEIEGIWTNYKEIVADAIISAAVTKSYEMGAIIATTSGVEVGNQLVDKFESIVGELAMMGLTLDLTVTEDVATAKLWIIIGMAVGTGVFFFALFIVAPAVSKPINKFKEVLQFFVLGNFDTSIEITSRDEFGELANMLRALRDAQKEKINAAEKIAAGSLEKVKPASDDDKLAFAFNQEVEIIEALLFEAGKLIDANNEGNLKVRGDVSKFQGGWKQIIEGINSILDATVAPIDEAGEVLETMAQGNFTKKMRGDYKGDYLSMKENVNRVIVSLSNVIGQVAGSSSELASSASQISSSTEEMAAGASEQSSQTTEVASAVEQMTKTIMESTRNANDAAQAAKEAGAKANEGGKVVVETIKGINRIAEVVTESAKTIQELGKSSDQIGEIIQVINDIAEQTNLLALNAAIEAARAGEQGRGFAVVADEVRKLAERTTKATKEIETMIKQIQRDTSGAVEAIQEGTKEVERGKELAQKAGDSLHEIIANSDRVSSIITQLAAASEEQSATSESISQNVEAINNVTHQTAQGTAQISHAAEDLYRLTSNMQELISHFKLANADEDEYTEGEHSRFAVRGNGKLIGH